MAINNGRSRIRGREVTHFIANKWEIEGTGEGRDSFNLP
jgi:hypothetical protein